MIGIVCYGSGNVAAITNVYRRLSVPYCLIRTADDLQQADKLILPGVGAFDQVMTQLDESGLRPALDVWATENRKPVLGICVGMQLLADASEEGDKQGLGWVRGRVRRFDIAAVRQLPHMGWNTVEPVRPCNLFREVDLDPGYYFLHSYHFDCHHEGDALATTWYGGRFTSVVNRENVFGVQFHPEKSHHAGTKLLENFSKLT